MITIFTTCRSFENERFKLIQTNALLSWLQLDPRPEVLVMGDDPGVKEFCEKHQITQVPEVELSEYGTPLFSSCVTLADQLGQYPYILHLSSDIIIFQEIYKALNALIPMGQFCGVCRKQDSWLDYYIDFNTDWVDKAKQNTNWSMITSGDLLFYPKGFYKDMPPFSVGRSFCDTYCFWYAGEQGCMVKMTDAISMIHQMHDHPHLPEGNPEYNTNAGLAAGYFRNIDDANWVLTPEFNVVSNTYPPEGFRKYML